VIQDFGSGNSVDQLYATRPSQPRAAEWSGMLCIQSSDALRLFRLGRSKS